jgi:LmbE family N-acetylglucosaminyl deacetylase
VRRKGHVCASDTADAEALLDAIEAGHRAQFDEDVRPTMKRTIAKLLADKREEWLTLAMIRAERTFRIKRKDGT